MKSSISRSIPFRAAAIGVALLTCLSIDGTRGNEQRLTPAETGNTTRIENTMAMLRGGFAHDPEKSFVHGPDVEGVDNIVMQWQVPISVCVVGESINAVAKRTTRTFFAFADAVGRTVDIRWVTSPMQCAKSTTFLLIIHDGAQDVPTFNRRLAAVLVRMELIPMRNIDIHAWGSTQILWGQEDKSVLLATATQIAPVLPSDGIAAPFVTSVIVQELFQSMFFGKDLEGRASVRSVLHEADVKLPELEQRDSPAPLYDSSLMGNFLEVNAGGLCEFDVLAAVALGELQSDGREAYGGDRFKAVPFKSFERLVRKRFREFESTARKLRDDDAFASIMDLSCE